MSGVERVQYMDNQLSGQMTEAYQKERQQQRKYFLEQEAAGRIKPLPPPAKQQHPTLLQTVGVPAHVQTHNQDPILAMNTSISKSMWTSNPGYLIRDGQRTTSAFKQDFVYDQEEIEYMKQHGYLDKKHNRTKDSFTNYVEAAARIKGLFKAPGSTS